MPEVPVITLEHLSKPRALTNLFNEYSSPAQQEAILKQLLEPPIVNELPRLFDIKKLVGIFSKLQDRIAKTLLTADMLQYFAQAEDGISIIAALADAFPNKKDVIAAKILHLDIFKKLAQSPAHVKALIEVFPEHKNGLSYPVFSKEVFQTLAINPAAIKSLIDLFQELPEYRTIIANYVFDPQMIHVLIDQNMQNALELANIFPERKAEINELILLSDPKLLQFLLRLSTNKVAELCRVFVDYPQFLQLVAKEVLENETFDILIQSATDVHDLTAISALTNTSPTFNNDLAQKIVAASKLPTLIKSSADIDILTSALPSIKDTIAQTALEDAVFQSLLKPPRSWVKPIKRLPEILSALADYRAEVAKKIVNPQQLKALAANDSDVELLLKALPELKHEIAQQLQDRNRFFSVPQAQPASKISQDAKEINEELLSRNPNIRRK